MALVAGLEGSTVVGEDWSAWRGYGRLLRRIGCRVWRYVIAMVGMAVGVLNGVLEKVAS